MLDYILIALVSALLGGYVRDISITPRINRIEKNIVIIKQILIEKLKAEFQDVK